MEYYSNYSFEIEDVKIRVTMVSYRKFRQVLPMHCHGENIYEIHYVAGGRGTVILDTVSYGIEEGTLYVTGPNVFHEQIPDKDNPVTEFGLYLHVDSPHPQGAIMSAFCREVRWVGRGRGELRHFMQQIILEHKRKDLGCKKKIKFLLA